MFYKQLYLGIDAMLCVDSIYNGLNIFCFIGYCEKDGYRVGFGQCTGKVLPALELS